MFNLIVRIGSGFVIVCAWGQWSAAQEVTRIALDVQEQGPTISPLLFGHNLEHTRRAVWTGISAEMVNNRKFAAVEEGGRPKRWTVRGPVSIDEQVTYAGKHAVRLGSPNGLLSSIGQQHKWLTFDEGQKYAFRVWTKSEAPQEVWIIITKPGKAQVIFEEKRTVQPGEWQLWSGEFTAPARVSGAWMEIQVGKRAVVWIGAVSLMPADNFHGMRRDVIKRLKQLRPGGLRWPGGCYAEFYRWQDGLLPVDQRPPVGPTGLPFLLPENDDYDSQEIGIDEFLALCREVGAEPALTVRVSESTPEDAAAWVEYCNGSPNTKGGQLRAQRGHAEPYAVRYWFIGNELIAFGRGDCKTPTGCATQSQRFATAMKAVDPEIDLTGCSWRGNERWNHALVAGAGQLLDQYSAHNYLLDTFKGKVEEIPRMPTEHVRPLLAGMQASLRRAVPAHRPVVLAFDEWNTLWGRSGSVGMGLYAAGVLNLLCRESESLGVARAYYFMPINEGAIQVDPLDARLDTAGEVFALFQVHQGNRVLKTPAPQAETDLDVCASVASTGKPVWVTVVNRNTTEARSLELTLRGVTAPAEAAAKFLVPASPDLDQREFHERDEKLAVEGDRVVVNVPAASIARVEIAR